MNSYKDSLDYVFRLGGKINVPAKYGLEKIKSLLDLINNPQDRLRHIHVAGTKGKGSTTRLISSILQASKYKVGMYISPSLVNISERISINGELIPPKKFLEYVKFLSNIYNQISKEDIPSTFETFTIIAFQYFDESEVDFSVLEVGLGGRLDATNIIKNPLVSVITEISYDHQKILGGNLSQIASEKAGIIKTGLPVVIGTKDLESKGEILKVAKERSAPYYCLGDDFGFEIKGESPAGTIFDFYSKSFKVNFRDLRISLLGKHQVSNASLAIQVLLLLKKTGINISDETIYQGIKNTFWPGRLEVIKKTPLVVLDGAHNGSSAKVLSENIDLFGRNVVLLFSMLSDKNVEDTLFYLSQIAKKIVITEVPNSFGRKLEADVIYGKAKHFFHKDNIEVIRNPREAYFKILGALNKTELLCVTGSLYLVGFVREIEKIFTFSNNVI